MGYPWCNQMIRPVRNGTMRDDQIRQRLNAISAVNWRTEEIQKHEKSAIRQMDRPSGADVRILRKHLSAIAELKRGRSACAFRI
jgi:hypothetical protein